MRILLRVAGIFFLLCPALFCTTLKEMYDLAGPGSGYDKFIELQPGGVYSGGLYIGLTFNRITAEFEGTEEYDVRIKGNGAVLDLQGGEICISYCENRLDIDDCVVINGNIRYRGISGSSINAKPIGYVKYVTFYKPHDYGVRIYGCGDDIVVLRNLFVDAMDTGPDFQYLSGASLDWLPTGANVAFSGLGYGFPLVMDNWSFHGDPAANADLLRHYSKICEYG
ncbi:MAG: hypothetical protein ABIK28_03805 [Planctomycetota bacterium]